MKTTKWILMLIGVAAILMAGQNAWADGRRGGRGHGGEAYQSQNHHGGSGYHHKKPQHGGPAVHHNKRPVHPQGHQYHRRPEPRPYYHEHHRRPTHHHQYQHQHHHQHHDDTNGFLFSARILDPAFALSIITGERW